MLDRVRIDSCTYCGCPQICTAVMLLSAAHQLQACRLMDDLAWSVTASCISTSEMKKGAPDLFSLVNRVLCGAGSIVSVSRQ